MRKGRGTTPCRIPPQTTIWAAPSRSRELSPGPVERSEDVDLDPATAQDSVAYAGPSYRWRALVLSAEVEKGALVSYAFRIGTRF